MKLEKETFEFDAVLSEVDGLFIKAVIFIPRHVVEVLPVKRVRVEGTFNGVEIALAVQNMKGGFRYFSVSAPLRKAARMKAGAPVKVRFRLVDPDKLDLPEELEAVLAQDDAARVTWNSLTTGYQRSLLHYITGAKNIDTRIKRSLELLGRAKAGLLHGQRKRKK